MSGEVGSVKRTNRLAVFEHVIEKELQSLKRERRSNVYKEDSDSEDNDLPVSYKQIFFLRFFKKHLPNKFL